MKPVTFLTAMKLEMNWIVSAKKHSQDFQEKAPMTIKDVGLVAIGLCIILSPLLYGGYLEWLENRRGGASDWQKARIRDLCKLLGQDPPPEEELESLSVKKAWKMAHRLDYSMSIRRRRKET